MLLWGAGWTALKILTYDLPIEVIIFWRFFIMSLSFLPILYFFKIPLTLNRTSLSYIAGSSVLNIAFMVSSFLGIKYGLAGAGSVIITTLSPVMTFLFVAIIFRKKLQNRQYFGLALGILGGVVLLQLNNINLFFNGSNIYFLLCAIIWAGVTILSGHSHKHKFWTAMIYLAVFGQTIATTLFFMASGVLGSEKTSSFMFLVPFFALLSAWFVLNEPIQMHIVIGGEISMVAVLFINKK